jgi:hypothetical protein
VSSQNTRGDEAQKKRMDNMISEADSPTRMVAVILKSLGKGVTPSMLIVGDSRRKEEDQDAQ